jgi:hypothetical protein
VEPNSELTVLSQSSSSSRGLQETSLYVRSSHKTKTRIRNSNNNQDQQHQAGRVYKSYNVDQRSTGTRRPTKLTTPTTTTEKTDKTIVSTGIIVAVIVSA